MLKNKWIGLATMITGLAACPNSDGSMDDAVAGDPTDPDEPVLGEQCGERADADASEEERALNARADLDVATALLAELGAEQSNVLLSPYSVRTAFGQVYGGTQGSAHVEIEQLLGFEGLGERTHAVLNSVSQDLQSRNATGTPELPELLVRPVNRSYLDIVYEDSVNDEWIALVEAYYGACIEVFDMNADHAATLERVNGWVSDQTNGLIPELVKALPSTVSAIVINALYFKASWHTPFERSLTREQPFTTWTGATVDVSMMHAPVLATGYAEGDGWAAVSLPYSDTRLEMVVIAPAATTEAAFEAALDGGVIEGIFDALVDQPVDLRIPAFTLKSTWGLRAALEAMGMAAAFNNGEDFTPMAPSMMPIFEVFHDVAIAIDDKGTEATAATAVVLGEDGGDEVIAEVTLVVDHPFYLAIRDRTAGAVLFFARIGDPTGG